MPRKMLYLWEDTDAPESEVKFGDHWVGLDVSLDEAVEDTRKYIRSTLNRQKHKFDEGRIVVHGIWDASEYAKKVDRFHPRSKVDDHMRHVIGHHVQADIHRIDPDVAVGRVLQELGKIGQPLRRAGLSMAQYNTTSEVVDVFRSNKKVVMADLCARFGKTVFAGAVVKELGNVRLVVVASYVLTVFTSFENDWRSFEQFREFEHVDTGEDGYQEKIDKYLKEGKKVVAYLSMHSSTKRQDRIDYLFKKKHKKMLVIDEADFGIHRDKQANYLINARKPNDLVLIMTGTNGERAVSGWNIDHYCAVTYIELLVNKKILATIENKTLKYFHHCLSRDKLVPDVEFYQLNLEDVVTSSETEWLEEEDGSDLLPSWAKFARNPMRAKGFWVRMLEAMFLGKHSLDSVNISHQTLSGDTRVSMMFLPSGMRNENLRDAVNIASEALPGFVVVPLSGYDNVSNRKAERVAKDAVEKARKNNKSVLFLATNLAQRSFSVCEITDLFLAYDGGDKGATIQKMSRALTPYKSLHRGNKVSRIYSMSLNPTRDDSLFDPILIESASHIKKSRNLESIKHALRAVLQSVDIFECTYDGAISVETDDYLNQIYSRNSLTRVIGRVADLSIMSKEEIDEINEGFGNYLRIKSDNVALSGKTKKPEEIKKTKVAPKKIKNSDIMQARKNIIMIAENMDVILYGTNTKTISEALNKAKKSKKIQEAVYQSMGVSVDLIQRLIDKGVIRKEYLEILYDQV